MNQNLFVGCIVVEQEVLFSDKVYEIFSNIHLRVKAVEVHVFLDFLLVELPEHVFNYERLAGDHVLHAPDQTQFEGRLVINDSGHHHARRVHQVGDRVIRDSYPVQILRRAGDLRHLRDGALIHQLGADLPDLVDDGGLARIRHAANLHPDTHRVKFGLDGILNFLERLLQIGAVLRGGRKALNFCLLVFVDELVRHALVAEIKLVENYDLHLVLLLYDFIKLIVAGGNRAPSVPQLQVNVDISSGLVHQPQCTEHVARKPVYRLVELGKYLQVGLHCVCVSVYVRLGPEPTTDS